MTAPRLEISPEARRDLRAIRRTIARSTGQHTALRWAQRLQTAALSLATAPNRGAVGEQLGGRRRLVVAPYLIIYRVDGEHVRVLRIIDGRRDLPSLMGDDQAE